MATLDEIRLRQLLAPFNQTGVMSSSQAVPMINSIPMINTGMIDQRLENTDLVNQIIEQNKIANMNKFRNTIAPLGNTQQIPLLDNTQQIPLQNLGIDTSYGVANEPDEEQVEYLTEQEPSGIAKLFEFLGKLPTPMNLARRGLESLRGFSNTLQNSDFGRSRTLMDYLDARSYGGRDARDRAASQNMREARAIQRQVDMRPSAVPTNQDRGRGQSFSAPTRSAPTRSAAATRSRDLGSMRGGVGR